MGSTRVLPEPRASRVVALAGIVVLHALAIAMGLAIRGPRPDEARPIDPIVITMTADSRPLAAPPAVAVKLQTVLPQPQPMAPAIQISLPVEASLAVTTVVATPAAPPDAVVGEAGEGPVTVANPDYLRTPAVVYPPAAKRARAQGLVHVRALVDLEGRANEVSVARSSGFELLDRAACEAVRGALFKPYRRNNVARSMVVIVPIDFNLKPSRGLGRGGEDLELDVRGEHHHAMRGHAEELGGLSAASLHVGE